MNSLCANFASGYIVKFAPNACNYYERGGSKFPLYFQKTTKLQKPTIDMHL
jgi:hypothetical protein